MISNQKDLLLLLSIIIINIGVTILYRYFETLKKCKKDSSPFANRTSFVKIFPSAFMPRVPFLILNNIENSNRKIAYLHNFLCLIIYAIFIYAMFVH
jgi:hypothetical protein